MLSLSKRMLTLIVTFVAISGQVFADNIPTAGYYDLSAPFVPQAVRTAADSVFEVVVMSPTAKHALDPEKLAIAEEIITASDESPQSKQLLLEQVKYCKKMNFNPCDIYFGVSAGTAFLLEDGQTLWTDYHVIENYVRGLSEHFKRPAWMAFMTLRHQNLPIAVFDRHKRLVFMGSKSDGRAEITAQAFDGHFVNYLKGEYRATSDFVKIRLSREIGPGLKLAAATPAAGDVVFALGFPTGTGTHATLEGAEQKPYLVTRTPYPDSDGNSFYVSPGRVLDQYEGWKHVFKVRDGRDITAEDFSALKRQSIIAVGDDININELILARMDAIFGNSGGPIVNSNGEVVGMAGSVAVELKDGSYVRTTVVSLNLVEVVKRPLSPLEKRD